MKSAIALKKLGLSDKEVRVYTTLLSRGPSPVRAIALAADINRGTTYDLLRHLIDVGLVAYYHQEKRQYFVAEDPSRLAGVVASKEQELVEARAAIDEAIPELRSFAQKSGGKPVVRYYEGERGVRNILQDVLDAVGASSEKVYRVYSCSSIRAPLYRAYPDFSRERIEKKIAVRVIAIGDGGTDAEFAERRWLRAHPVTPDLAENRPASAATGSAPFGISPNIPHGASPVSLESGTVSAQKRVTGWALSGDAGAPTYVMIYGEKTAFISLDASATLLGVLVEDAGTAATQRLLFDSLWATLAPTV